MGGIGSGTSTRWNKKTTLEETKRVDIRYMRKAGLLRPGSSGSLSWTTGGEPTGNINYSCFSDSLLLKYRFRSNGDEWEPVEQRVMFDFTPCNYGGKRTWILCPECDRRVVSLCSYGKFFLCRHCYQVPYGSQNEGFLDRVISQKHKLGKRIFENYDGDGWRKKKWIHQKTFDRLYKKYRYMDDYIENQIYTRMGLI